MKFYLVFEEVPAGELFNHNTGRMEPVPAKVPMYHNLITLVQAEEPDAAIKLVVSATKRLGRYAVVEVEHVNFTVNGDFDTEDGVLKQKQEQLSSGDD